MEIWKAKVSQSQQNGVPYFRVQCTIQKIYITQAMYITIILFSDKPNICIIQWLIFKDEHQV